MVISLFHKRRQLLPESKVVRYHGLKDGKEVSYALKVVCMFVPQKGAAYRNRYVFPRSCRYLERHGASPLFSIAEGCNATRFLWFRSSSDLHWLYREDNLSNNRKGTHQVILRGVVIARRIQIGAQRSGIARGLNGLVEEESL